MLKQFTTLALLTTTIALQLRAAEEPTAPPRVAMKFNFSSGKVKRGWTQILPATIYDATNGFGFEPGANLTAGNNFITSDKPFLFSVKLPEGNYKITVTLGDTVGASTNTVKAEARRLMFENVHTAKGKVATQTITVNVRTPKISDDDHVHLKKREVDTEMITWDDKLTLEFNGSRPCVRTLEIAPAPEVPTIFIAGDSTVCDQPAEPWNSWGQMLTRFLKPDVAVANYAESGESVKSSLGARRFEKIFNLMKPGDWLLIQFGHNDMKDRATDAQATYRANLKQIIARTRAKGGTPVLITSMERKGGVNAPTLLGYPEAMREVVREEGAALIDLNAMSLIFYKALGADLGKAFQDGTHHNNYGSYELARCVVEGIKQNKLGLVKFLTKDSGKFDPAHPDPLEKFSVPPSAARSTDKPEGN